MFHPGPPYHVPSPVGTLAGVSTGKRRYLETRDSVIAAHVTPAEQRRLHRAAALAGVTLAEAIREGTRAYLRQLARDVRETGAGVPPQSDEPG